MVGTNYSNVRTPLVKESSHRLTTVEPYDIDAITAFCSSCLFNENDPQKTLRSVINTACRNKDFDILYKKLQRKYNSPTPVRLTSTEQFFSTNPQFPNTSKLTLRALGTQLFNNSLKNYYSMIRNENKLDALVNLFINTRTLFDKVQSKSKSSRASGCQSREPLRTLNWSGRMPRASSVAAHAGYGDENFYKRLAEQCREELSELHAPEPEFSEA